ncbi:MAG: tRNA (guanosine(46)-N7)-methyltransferase TrmB [Patescibacteria group bacterium]|nr:tRNA (guanosine(46)-N7)-methyltransferase TrmB [Patescibacteria group bacterium]
MILADEDLKIAWEEGTGALDWQSEFGNNNPVEIEIGIGKGRFLLNSAQNKPDVNFLGIEWAKKYLSLARERAWKRKLYNVRFLRADAKKVVEEAIPHGSVAAFHIYFPDPWPKRRHHKRRFFQPDTVVKLVESLIPDGKLLIATDYKEYFEWIMQVISGNINLKTIPLDSVDLALGRTNYEIKYINEGRPIFNAFFQKIT